MRLLSRLWLLCCLGLLGFWAFRQRETLTFYLRGWADEAANELDRTFIVSLLLADLGRFALQYWVPVTLTWLAMLLGLVVFRRRRA